MHTSCRNNVRLASTNIVTIRLLRHARGRWVNSAEETRYVTKHDLLFTSFLKQGDAEERQLFSLKVPFHHWMYSLA